MNDSPKTDVLKAIFLANGLSSDIYQLPEYVSGVVQQLIAVGDTIPATGKVANEYSIVISLFDDLLADRTSFIQVENWLIEHSNVLAQLNAQKIIEFQSFLPEHVGSRIVTLPHSIIRLCSNAGIGLACQTIRTLTKSEIQQLRKT